MKIEYEIYLPKNNENISLFFPSLRMLNSCEDAFESRFA